MQKPSLKIRRIGVILPGLLLLVFIPTQLLAQRTTLSFQALLTDTLGQAVPNGDYDFTFRIYTQPSGGSSIWGDEMQTLPVTNGILNAMIGSQLPLDLPFDDDYYLGIKVGTDPEIDPRQPLSAAPYSFGLNLPFTGSTVASPDAFVVSNGATASNSFAIHGIMSSTTMGGYSTALRGENRGIAGNGIGVWGSQDGIGWGVYGRVNGAGGRGVYGRNDDVSSGYAGYFAGRVHVTGSLSKGSGSFKIDHPLDPANRYLYHSFVESPDMMNVYNGNVTLDDVGEAEVALPDWFEALNRDYRYQLTPIGEPGPNLYIAEQIQDGHFRIAGGAPGQLVSWQVTGIRHDAFARQYPIPVEEDKPDNERGLYLHPTAFGLDESLSIETTYDITGEK